MERTLAYELKRFYENNKKLKAVKKEDYENLVSFFDSYYGGKSIDREEYGIMDTSMGGILSDSSDFIINIVQGVKSYPNDKSKLSERLEIFLNHLNNKYDLEYNENIFENFKIKDKNERLLMMLKYLHSGEKSRSDIAEDFGISERTVADYISTLQDGFSFLGTEMNIRGLERTTNKYNSLIHPIFSALNSSEIYSLTVGLKLLSKDTVFEDSLGRIANLVYEQLSDNSKEMIDKHKEDTISFGNDKMKFIDSRKLGQMHDSPFAYFLKEPIECIVTYNDGGKYINSKGILKLAKPSIGNKYNKVIIENVEGAIILDMDKVMSIKRVDEQDYFYNW